MIGVLERKEPKILFLVPGLCLRTDYSLGSASLYNVIEMRMLGDSAGRAWAVRQIAIRKNYVYATSVPLKGINEGHVTSLARFVSSPMGLSPSEAKLSRLDKLSKIALGSRVGLPHPKQSFS